MYAHCIEMDVPIVSVGRIGRRIADSSHALVQAA
jgi:hypothetical protein